MHYVYSEAVYGLNDALLNCSIGTPSTIISYSILQPVSKLFAFLLDNNSGELLCQALSYHAWPDSFAAPPRLIVHFH